MTERMVEIPVWRDVRDRIKQEKGTLTYSEFLSRLVQQLRNN